MRSPTRCCLSSSPTPIASRRRTFDADDEFSNPESPLDRLESWVNVELDLGDGPKPYRRDTNVMPQWAVRAGTSCATPTRRTTRCSSIRPSRRTGWAHAPTSGPTTPAASTSTSAVSSTPCSTSSIPASGTRCSTTSATCRRRSLRAPFNQGYILADAFKDEHVIYIDAFDVEERDGEYFHGRPATVTRESGKMGKSLKNAVSPDEMYEAYGADTLRLYEMAMGPLDASRPWETRRRGRYVSLPAAAVAGDGRRDNGRGRRRRCARRRGDTRILHRTIDTVRTARWTRCGSTRRSPN